MRAFIIRPFGKKKDGKGDEIDFDAVARDLIDPALTAVGAEGRETLDIVQSGNIRTDMFRRLLTADLVVADLYPDVVKVCKAEHRVEARVGRRLCRVRLADVVDDHAHAGMSPNHALQRRRVDWKHMELKDCPGGGRCVPQRVVFKRVDPRR